MDAMSEKILTDGRGILKRKNDIMSLCVCLMVFIFFSIFFFKIHPIVIFDTDDWKFFNYHRKPIPIWNARNPAKVLSETLMPIIGEFSAYIIYPVCGDFFKSMSLAMALTVSSFVTGFYYNLHKMLQKLCAGKMSATTISMFILISHFLVMRVNNDGNKYMLYTVDATCYFHYIIPDLVNCILVLWLMREDILKDLLKKNGVPIYKKAILCVLLYFGLFSNLFSSIILAAYVGALLLCDLINDLRIKNFRLKKYVSANKEKLCVIMVWGIAQIFEAGGNRASDFSSFSLESIKYVFKTLKQWPHQVNTLFCSISIFTILLGSILMILKKNEHGVLKNIKIILVAFGVCFLYLSLLCAKLQGYMLRPDATYGIFFFIVVLLGIYLVYLGRELPWIRIALPLMLIIMFMETDTSGKTFLESTKRLIDPEICIAIDNDIMNQLIEAEKCGKTEIMLYVPEFDTDDNWPIATYANNYFPEALYKYGILSEKIKITEIIPTQEKNIEFNIK